jgi:hypothetical protein
MLSRPPLEQARNEASRLSNAVSEAIIKGEAQEDRGSIPMPIVSITLTDAQAERLTRCAERLGIRAEDVALAATLDALDMDASEAEGRLNPSGDTSSEFRLAAKRVVTKNAELYLRLS